MATSALYEPINVLKPVDPEGKSDIWIVDGPIIPMRPLGFTIPFPTRMTVVRLTDGGLWLHSPVAAEPGLVDAVSALGPVRHIVAPNKLHYWWAVEWQARFPEATTFAAPGTRERAAAKNRPLRVDKVLGDDPDPAWGGAFRQVMQRGSFMEEVAFLHVASRTLIVADLIHNYEREKLTGPWLLLLMRLGGLAGGHAGVPRDLRLTFLGQRRRALREAARTMIGWAPERIVLAHGRRIERDGTEALRRALAWLDP